MTEQTASIYGLKDQRTQEIFYVGMSIDPFARYGQHVMMRNARDAKESRILDMRKDKLMPELVIFEENIPLKNDIYQEDAYEREKQWIRYYLNLGMPLTNSQNLSIYQTRKKRQPKQEKPMFALRQLREKYYISREKLAKLAGVSYSVIMNMEGRLYRTKSENLDKVLKALSEFTGKEITRDDIAN